MEAQRGDGIQKTKHMLAGALMRLLEKHSFRKISVGDICQEALVSRSAFYVHFQDKYELLKFCLRNMLIRQDERTRGQTLEKRIIVLLESVQKNQRMMRNVFAFDYSQELVGIFEETFREFVGEQLERLGHAEIMKAGPAQMVSAFLAGGMANIVICWIQERFQTPVEEVARCQCTLLIRMIGADAQTVGEWTEAPGKKGGEACVSR